MCKYLSSTSAQPNISTPFIPNAPTQGQFQQQNRTHLSLFLQEAKSISAISIPLVLTGLLLYTRSIISMIFLGRISDLALAGGSLAIGFANITGYSLLSGLAVGMEPMCCQAFGAERFELVGLITQRMILLLLTASLPISLLWLNMKRILLFFRQDEDISTQAQYYILYSIPDLFLQSLIHPLRIYLRSHSSTLPLTYSAAQAVLLHFPINYFLVTVLDLGIKGVALAAVWTNFNFVASLIMYIVISGVYKSTWAGLSLDCLKGLKSLINLAIPSCISVCLEWWWYEIMTLMCGLLVKPRATVASMGILIQTTSLIYIFPSSLSFAVSTRVGNELGAARPDKAKQAVVTGMTSSLVLALAALTFTITVRKKWARMFTNDDDITCLTMSVLPIIGLCELGNCPQTTACGVLRGSAKLRTAANVNLGSFYLVGMPVALSMGFLMGLEFRGLWLGLLAAQSSCAVTMLIVLSRMNWEEEARIAKESMQVDFAADDDAGASGTVSSRQSGQREEGWEII